MRFADSNIDLHVRLPVDDGSTVRCHRECTQLTETMVPVEAINDKTSGRIVTDGFDVVTVRIQHEGAIVVGVIMRSWTRRSVVTATGRQGRLIEGIHGSTIG